MSNVLNPTQSIAQAQVSGDIYEAKKSVTEKVLTDYGTGQVDTSHEQIVDFVLDTTRDVTEAQQNVSPWRAMAKYPKAMFWSCTFTIGIIMAGYDANIITSFFAMPTFVDRYGEMYQGKMQISAAWQTGLSMGSPIGQVLGSLAVSWPSERYGRKWIGFICTILLTGIVFIQMFAPSAAVLTVGEILAGLMWGAFITLCPTYASEVAPTPLRGFLTSFTNMAFVIGQFICQGVIAGCQNRTDQWSYRIPFALQWIWCLVLLVAFPFAPESPWYLVRNGKREEARETLKKLQWDRGVDLDQALAMIEQTNLLEQEFHKKTSYWDCFKGRNLVRTEICSMVYATQVLAGNPLMGYSTYFFELAGLAVSKAFYMSVGMTAIGFTATMVCFYFISLFGRRPLYLFGMVGMTILLLLVGILDCPPNYLENLNLAWAQAALLLIYAFVYQLTSGPLTFILITEISSTRLRSRTIGVSTAIQAVCAIITTVAVPYMFNEQNANMRGKIGFFFGGLSFLCLIWSIFRLPETKDRTFHEIDIMFEKKINLMKFQDYDVYRSAHTTKEVDVEQS